MVKHLENSDDFKKEIASGFVLVDFYTEWCGPCKMLAPILEEIDYMNVLKIDADKFMDLAQQFGIMSVPTLCFFQDGELKERVIGYRNAEEIKEIYQKISGN